MNRNDIFAAPASCSVSGSALRRSVRRVGTGGGSEQSGSGRIAPETRLAVKASSLCATGCNAPGPQTDLPPCSNRYYSPGAAACGADVPHRALSAYFPGDEPGFRCALTLEHCSEFPIDCPEWKPSEMVCPVCIEYGQRYAANPFKEAKLLTRGGQYCCPECCERFESAAAVAVAALDALRDSLDNENYLESLA